MYALVESPDAINLYREDRIVSSYKFRDINHAHEIYKQIIQGSLPEEIKNFITENDVKEIITEKSFIKGCKKEMVDINIVANQRKLKELK